MTFEPIYEEFLKGLETPKHADYGYLLLQVLATQTGGQALYLSNNLSALIDKCSAEVKAYYVLSFNPPSAAHPNVYHPIEVQVDKPGAKVRTRTIYYSSPATPAK
jgi:VWFA-related protein